MKIYLIGLTGAGKSTIGRLLAKKLSYSFVDLDERIAYQTNRTIADIFEKDGEDSFRELENKFLKDVSSKEDIVIATGGGTPCYLDGLKFIKENGISVFLFAPIDIITERLYVADNTYRPLLKNKSKEELNDYLSQRFTDRLPFYSNADMMFDTNCSSSFPDLVDQLAFRIEVLNKNRISTIKS